MKIKTTAIIMAAIIILAALYVFFGKNWLTEQHYIHRQRNTEYIRNELMERLLDIQSQSQEVLNEILQQNYQLQLFPHQSIELNREWTLSFEEEISYEPMFDHKYLYIIAGDMIRVLHKRNHEEQWSHRLSARIINMTLLDANRLTVVTENHNVICFNRDNGMVMWEQTTDRVSDKTESRCDVYQISLNEFRRLDRSVILLPGRNSIDLLDNLSGERIARYESESEIRYISSFNMLERSIYIVEDDQLSMLRFDVR